MPSILHSDWVLAVAFSPDGTHLLSGGRDRTLKLWDAATGQLIRSFEGHGGSVHSVAFSPDGARLLSGGTDDTLKLWNAATGRLIRSFEGHRSPVESVAFSPDGRHAVSGSADNTLKLWDAATGQLVHTLKGHAGRVQSVAFSPDGTRLLSGSHDSKLKLWDAITGELIRTFEGHGSGVSSVAFSPDGTHLLSGSYDGTLKLWDAATGQLVRTMEGHADVVNSVAFSPDGTHLLSGSGGQASDRNDKTLKLWDAATGQLIRTFAGHADGVYSVAFSPSGTHVLSGSFDNTLKLWDATTGHLIRTTEQYADTVRLVAFSPDGTRLLSVDKTLKLWDAATGRLIRTFEGDADAVRAVAFSPDGTRLLSGSGGLFLTKDKKLKLKDNTLKMWDTATGALLRTFEGHADGVYSVAFSPNGTWLLSGGWDNTLKLWDAATGQLIRTFQGHTAFVHAVAFSPDGTRVLSGSSDNTLKLWDAATGQMIRTFQGHTNSVYAVAFSPDGTRVLSGSDFSYSNEKHKTLKLWDAASGQLIRSIEGLDDRIAGVAFSPDGTRLLSISGGFLRNDNSFKLWDAAGGQLIRTVEGHASSVTSAVFSPDGTRIASGSADTTIRIWDAATGSLIATLIGDRGGESLAMSPNGFFTASRKGTEMLNVVRGLEAYSVMQFYDHLHRPDIVEELLKGDPEGKYKDESRKLNLEKILDSGPAPRIELLPNRTDKRGETVRLAARLVDEGGGIGSKVLWRVNGKTQGATAPPGLGRPLSMGDYVIMEQTLTVDPSKRNEVEIIATNGKRLLATQPLRFSIDAWGVAEKERPRLFVLAVGVDKYAKAEWQLRYAAKDATSFAEALKLVGSPLFSDVQVKTLIDAEVTERSIAAEFERLAATVKARDVFVLFLGGHGRSFAGEGWFYVPQDFDLAKGHTMPKDLIGPDKLRDWLAKVPAEKSLIVLDACESGASEAFRGGDRERETVIAQLEHATGRNYIAAAPAGKAAYEGYNGHGVLTYAILEALHRPKDAAADPVSVFGIAAHISREVPAISQKTFGIRQQPRFIPIGEDFPLGVRQPVLKADDTISKTPTHFLIRPERVRQRGAVDAEMGRSLPPGFEVRVIEESADGWAAIARDGERLGYVPIGALLKKQ